MTRRKKRRWRGTWRDAQQNQSAASTIASTVLGLALVVHLIWVLRLGAAPLQSAVALNSRLPPCPVGETPINFSHQLATVAGPVFFGCEHCAEKYEAYPSRYRENLIKQREVLAEVPRVQVKCPVTGKPFVPRVSLTMPECESVYFCSEACKATFQRDPASYAEKLAEQGLNLHL